MAHPSERRCSSLSEGHGFFSSIMASAKKKPRAFRHGADLFSIDYRVHLCPGAYPANHFFFFAAAATSFKCRLMLPCAPLYPSTAM